MWLAQITMLTPAWHRTSVGVLYVLRRYDDDRTATLPLFEKRQHFVGACAFAVNEDGVCAGFAVRLGAPERFIQTPASDQRLDASDDVEVGIPLRVFARFDLADELADVGEWLPFALNETIRLGKAFVFDADPRDPLRF